MSDLANPIAQLPPEQQAIRAKCVHPTGGVINFNKKEIEQSIPARFGKIVQMYPERIAIKTKGCALTYDELNKAANRLAKQLLTRQSTGNEPVAIFLEHGEQVIIALLGILKAGKIFVVVDPTFPEERVKYIVEDAQACLLVTNENSLSQAKSYMKEGAQLVNMDELEGFTSEEPALWLSPDSRASLVYTSGSTGRPKGVIQTHRNILHTILRDTEAVNVSPHDRLSLLRSNSTPGAIVDLFDGLLNGATVYPYSILKEGLAGIAAWLVQEEITIFNSVSSTFRHFLGVLGVEGFPHLRLIYVGGEPVYKSDVELYKKHFAEECILVVRLGCGEAGKVCQYMIDKERIKRGHSTFSC